jgi:hypothetical protein
VAHPRQGEGKTHGSNGVGDVAAAAAAAAAATAPRFPSPVILVACVASPDSVAPPLRRCFTHELAVDAPDQPARRALLEAALAGAGAGAGADGGPGGEGGLSGEVLEELARHTAGLLPREVRVLGPG